MREASAQYEAAPLSWGKALKPSKLGLWAVIGVGALILIWLINQGVSRFLYSSVGLHVLYGGLSIAYSAIVVLVCIGIVVVGLLAFHRSGRREAVALAAAAIGAFELVFTVLSFIFSFINAVIGY